MTNELKLTNALNGEAGMITSASAAHSSFVICHSQSARGSALMLVLWAIIMMSVAVAGVVEFIRYGIDENVIEANQFRALHLAESGISIGLNTAIKPGDPALKQQISDNSSFEVVISSEGERIPINYITDAGYREAVYNLFITWGLSSEEAGTAADSIADWVDTDEDQRSQGAEADYYKSQGFAGFPRNQGFTSVEEMILVRGMDAVERAKPDWREYFSIYGDGLIDLNHAPKELIMAVCNAADTDVDNLIRERDGPDGIAGTEDDTALTDKSAKQLLGLDDARYAQIQSRITTDHSIRRVESTGHYGDQRYKVVVIAKRQTDGSLNYLARTEE